MESVESGHGIKRTVDTLRGTKRIDVRPNSNEISLYKADILLRRTLIFAPMVSALDRLHCIYHRNLIFSENLTCALSLYRLF